jgi:hypothetical protein
MNAYELADFLDYELIDIFPKQEETIKMLRFQQDEINALREQVQYLQTQVYGGTTK